MKSAVKAEKMTVTVKIPASTHEKLILRSVRTKERIGAMANRFLIEGLSKPSKPQKPK